MIDGLFVYGDITPVGHVGRRKHLPCPVQQAEKNLSLTGGLGLQKSLTFDCFGALGRQDR